MFIEYMKFSVNCIHIQQTQFYTSRPAPILQGISSLQQTHYFSINSEEKLLFCKRPKDYFTEIR